MSHHQVGIKAKVEEGLSPSGVQPSLGWLISPVSTKVFFEEYWEKQPLVVKRNQPDYFTSLLSLEEVDRIITTTDFRYPNITLKNADREIASDDYTLRGNSVDAAKVYQLFGEGSTITLAFLDTVIPTLDSLCRSLELEFSFPFQTNAYLTPAMAKGAKHHYDTHDVFVLQVVNSKQWTTYGTPLELPLAGQDFDSSVHERGVPTLRFELEAGDIAYLPRGLVHDARSGEGVSLHITVGVLCYTWADLVLEAAADLSLNDVAFRKALPPGFARQKFDRAQARETFRTLLQELSARSNFEAILDRFIDEFISKRPPLLRGQMAQMAKVDRVTIDSAVGARANAFAHIRTDGNFTSVDCFGRKLLFPVHATEAVRFALSNPHFIVKKLPGALDDEGKLVLIRRLIREGLLVALSS